MHPKLTTPDEVENALLDLGKRIQTAPTEIKLHPQQGSLPEWRGADVIITSDFTSGPPHFNDGIDLVVRTQHAQVLTWLFFELRDAFQHWLDVTNKYGFFGALADAALKHLAENQPEPDDPTTLLKSVLSRGFDALQVLRKEGFLLPNAPIVIHSIDDEGRQFRHDAETGEETL